MTAKIPGKITLDECYLMVEDLKKRGLRFRRKMTAVLIILSAALGLMVIQYLSFHKRSKQFPSDSVLMVRGLMIVDDQGTPRLQIGAPLPDPPILGRRISRGSTAHGILLFDSEGNERGSFVTIDESGLVMLSLDETARMAAQFFAYPAGGARMRIRDRDQNIIFMGTTKEGPFLNLSRKDESLILQPDKRNGQK